MSGKYDVGEHIHQLRQWIGYHEGGANYNIFSYWQYGQHYSSWCVSFLSYCAYQAGYRFPSYSQYGEKGDSSCYYLRTHAMRQGIWRPTSTVARPGWACIFNFGQPDMHGETVIADSGGPTFATIGGNTSNGVYYRTRYRSQCQGFVAFDQAGQNLATVSNVTTYPSQEVNVSILVPAGAKVKGGRAPLYDVTASGEFIVCKNNAHLKWRGVPTNHPAEYWTQGKRLDATTVAYRIPQNAPHRDIIQMHDPVTLKPQKIGAVIGNDGGCAFFDIILP